MPTRRNRYRVERTADRLLTDESRLRAFISAGAPSERPRADDELETAVSYLTAIRQKHRTLSAAPWRSRIEASKLARIDEALADALLDITLPDTWVTRHAGISLFAMQRMLRGLQGVTGSIERFLPIDPENRDAGLQYGRIFEMMGHYMTGVFGQGARCQALGILTTNWMLGQPVKQIIASRIAWNRKKKRTEDTATAIRKTLEDVEQIARFQAPRYLACYSDIVRHMLILRGDEGIARAIPDLTLSLEFGVRGPVQLGLMTLGLSRSATLAIADPLTLSLAPADILRAHEVPTLLVDALRELAIDALKLPVLVHEEVVKFQATLRRQQAD